MILQPLEGVACVDDVNLAAVLLATSKSRRWQSALALWGETMPLGDGSGMALGWGLGFRSSKKMHIIAYIYIYHCMYIYIYRCIYIIIYIYMYLCIMLYL